ncbi:MAG: hypothetical protein HY865_03280 [Chloroflexi bacterium]|nr:hypothetical protein [Chloroflexota bacterium]
MRTESKQLGVLILVFGLLLGAYARILPALMVGFPVTDGGLFYEMVKALQANHYILPAFVEYNGISIPFAYPPLGFYVTALVSDLFRLPLIEAFRWLPAAGSLFFFIAFLPMASAVLKSPLKGILATVFFALLPRSFAWTIMGGGVTRVWGQFFLMLILWSAYKLFTAPSRKYLILTILFGSGVILSHPDASLHAASLCLVLWLFYGRSKEGIKNALLTALGIVLLTAPFFATVISRHGLSPYLNASQTGLSSAWAWLAIFTGSFAEEKFVTLVSALALLGLVVALSKREFLLPVWLFLPALIDPRGAASILLIPWAMLAATAFVDIILRGLAGEGFDEADWGVSFGKSAAIKAVVSALIFYTFAGAVLSDQVYPKVSLSASDRAALDWVRQNVPAGSHFVIVTGETEAFADSVAEWFPALTESVSIATIQGYEWMPNFQQKLDDYYALQACMNKGYECVEEWGQNSKQDFEYVLVSQNGLAEGDNLLVTSLVDSTTYRLEYQDGDVAIFKRSH